MSTSTPAPAENEDLRKNGEKWRAALRQLTEALTLLDASNAPPEVGAELDHAIHHLRKAIERSAHDPE